MAYQCQKRRTIKHMAEHVKHGFGPVWNENSRVLVLGSMPSPQSRQAAFYYMHPRNRFWPVMAALCAGENGDDTPGDTPQTRRDFALRHGIALWDVIASCDIDGASDASIRHAVPNDPTSIIRESHIAVVVTTGAKASQLYQRLCVPLLTNAGIEIPHIALPSTSPANAAMSLDDLVDVYRPALAGYIC